MKNKNTFKIFKHKGEWFLKYNLQNITYRVGTLAAAMQGLKKLKRMYEHPCAVACREMAGK